MGIRYNIQEKMIGNEEPLLWQRLIGVGRIHDRTRRKLAETNKGTVEGRNHFTKCLYETNNVQNAIRI